MISPTFLPRRDTYFLPTASSMVQRAARRPRSPLNANRHHAISNHHKQRDVAFMQIHQGVILFLLLGAADITRLGASTAQRAAALRPCSCDQTHTQCIVLPLHRRCACKDFESPAAYCLLPADTALCVREICLPSIIVPPHPQCIQHIYPHTRATGCPRFVLCIIIAETQAV